jgi:Flp pilus assembly protein TadD
MVGFADATRRVLTRRSMGSRRADVVRISVACWIVLALHGGGDALQLSVASAQSPGAAGFDDVDLDAPDVGRAPPVRPPVDAGVPAAPRVDAASTPLPTGSVDAGTPAAMVPAPPPDPNAAATPPPAPPADGTMSFQVRPWERGALLQAAAAHFAAGGDAARSARTLLELEHALGEAGVHGVRGGVASSSIGAALAREADRLAVAGDKARATEVAALALRAAPDDTAVAARLAHVRWTTQGLSAAGDITELVRRSLHEPLRASDLVVRVLGAAGLVVLALLAVFCVCVAWPTLRLLAFDLWLWLPRGSHKAQGSAFALLLAAVPVVTGAGAVVAALWFVLLAFPYLRRSARVWIVCVGVMTASLPLLVDAWSRAVVVAGHDADVVAAALYDVDADDARAALRAREARGEDLPVLAQAALAVAARREGRIDEAVDRWRAIAERVPEQGWAHGGYGVALATAGRTDVAVSELKLAIERAQHDADTGAVAAFNASSLLQAIGRSDAAQATVHAATPTSTGLMAVLRRATFRSPDEVVAHNRAFVDVLPPRRLLVDLAWSATADSAAVAAAVGTPLWGSRLTGPRASAALASFVVLWGVLAFATRRRRLARPCVRCGAPASRRVDAREVPEGTCSACFHAFLSKQSRVDPVVKLRRERAILVRGRVRSALVIALSVWPGAGHLFAASIGRGALLLTTSTAAFAALLAVSDLLPGPAAQGPWSAWLLGAPLFAVVAFTFLVSLRGALGLADDERSGGAR